MKRLFFLLMMSMLWMIVLPAQAATTYDSVFVTSQRYDRGEMIWRSDVGTILVLSNDGQVKRFSVQQYGALPPNPWRVAPLGKTPPMMGFGKVWANYDEIRASMGWPRMAEVGRDTPITLMDDGTLYLLNQSARAVRIKTNNTWEFVDSIPDTRPNPPQAQPFIRSFSVSPDTGTVGTVIDVSWNLENVDAAIIEFYDAYPRNDILYRIEDYQPAIGRTQFVIPKATLHGITVTIHGVRYDVDAYGRRITARLINASEVVTLETDDEPVPTETWAVYQAYDNGFMIWRTDTGRITVFFDDGTLRNYPLTYYAYLADVPSDIDVPEGKVRPTNGFGRVWAYLDDVRDQLDWAIDTETGYDLAMTTLDDGEIEYTLPDAGSIYVNDTGWRQ